jgi:hypothetical protein
MRSGNANATTKPGASLAVTSVAEAECLTPAVPCRAMDSIRMTSSAKRRLSGSDPERSATSSLARSAPGARWSPATMATVSAAARVPTTADPSSKARASRGSAGTRARVFPKAVTPPASVTAPNSRSTSTASVHGTGWGRVRKQQALAAWRTPAGENQRRSCQVCYGNFGVWCAGAAAKACWS